MDDLPVPDVLDRRGRARRLVIALIVGITVGTLAFGALYALARPDPIPGEPFTPHNGGAWRFVGYFTVGAGAGAFSLTLALANYLAKRRNERERVPPARQIS